MKIGKSFSVKDQDVKFVCSFIKKQNKPIVCINDSENLIDFDIAKRKINNALKLISSKKSNFEL